MDVSAASGACPDTMLTARNIGVFDCNGDGLLDLFVREVFFPKLEDKITSLKQGVEICTV